jgi:hypothetical protein
LYNLTMKEMSSTNTKKNISVIINEITNINSYSQSFDFLKDEPELYSIDDLKK